MIRTMHCIGVLLLVAAGQAQGALITLVLHTDAGQGELTASGLLATGRFATVDHINAGSRLPSLATLQSYDAVLAYTNHAPANASGWGDLLADYVNGGGHLVLASYAYTNPWAVAGRITTSGYAPLVNFGFNGNVSGNLVPTVLADPIFDGVDPAALTYFHNSNFAHPGLDIGATLLATDGAGVNMIARNPAGNVIGLNLFPSAGPLWADDNSPALYQLFANALTPQQVDPVDVPEPATLAIWTIAGAAGLALGSGRRRRQKPAAAVARTF